MQKRLGWSEEQQAIVGKSKRLAKCGVCCFAAAGPLLLLLTLPEVVHLLRTAPPVLGVDLMRWAIDLFGLWGFCGSACVVASAALSIRLKERRSQP